MPITEVPCAAGLAHTDLDTVAPDFVEAPHLRLLQRKHGQRGGRPCSRAMHLIGEWDGSWLTGWLASVPSLEMSHLAGRPYVSCAYHDGWAIDVVADSRIEPITDEAGRTHVWELFRAAPLLGFDPGAIGVPGWDAPTAPGFVVAWMDPWRVPGPPGRPGVGVELRTWRAAEAPQ